MSTATLELDLCQYCWEPPDIDVLEYYPENRSFTLTACCELQLQDAYDALAEVASDRKYFNRWVLEHLGIKTRQLIDDPALGALYGSGGFVLDYGLRLGDVRQKVAKEFCRKHHRHNRTADGHKPPVGWRWGHGLYNGDELIAVAMVGRAVARALDPKTVVEVNRVCVSSDAGRLGWNACSMLYGAAAKEARKRGFSRVITYTHETEPGTTLKAAGWIQTGRVKGRSWNTKSRPRDDKHLQIVDKIRWEAWPPEER